MRSNSVLVRTILGLITMVVAARAANGEIPPPYWKISPSGKVRFILSDHFHVVGDDYVSPHITWAKPRAGGAVKALIVAPRWAHRETVELSERLSLEYETIMAMDPPDVFAPDRNVNIRIVGCAPEEYRAEFERKLAGDYDILVFGNYNWNVLPPEIATSVLDKVEKGTGLLLVLPPGIRNETLEKILSVQRDTTADRYIEDGLPVKHVPGLLKVDGERREPLVRCARHGAGNVVVLSYNESSYASDYSGFAFTPKPTDDVVEPALAYDYYHSLVARAAIWAAGKLPPIRLTGINIAQSPVGAEQFANAPIEVSLRSDFEKAQSATLEVVARTWDGHVEQSRVQNVNIAAEDSKVVIQLPRLSGGPHFIDVWIRQNEMDVDWFSGYVEIVPAATVTAIDLAHPSFPIGANVEGSVTIEGIVPAAAQLEIEMVDSFGRLMARDVIGPKSLPGPVYFSFPFLQPVAIQHCIVATLVDEHGTVHKRQQLFAPQNLHDFDDFTFVAWGAGGTNACRQRLISSRCYELGMDSAYSPPSSGYEVGTDTNSISINWQKDPLAYWTTRAGLNLSLYASYLGGQMNGRVRSPCLSDPAYIAGKKEQIGSAAQVYRQMGGVLYSTGDEYSLAQPGEDGCCSEHCLADLRTWLKRKYGTLGRLNNAWGSRFDSWDQIVPPTLEEAKASNNFAAWSDGRVHMEHVFANIHGLLRSEVDKHHPGAPVGEEGMWDSDTYWGVDWELFRDEVNLLHGYDRPTQHEQIRSFAPQGSVTGYWFGSYPDGLSDYAEPKMRWHPWFSLFNGYNSAWWWLVSGNSTERECGFSPDLTVSPPLDWAMQEVREIKRGPGKLLLNCRRQHDGIAIHYSMASSRAMYAHGFGKQHWTGAAHHARLGIAAAKTAWNMILEDLGFQYEYVSTADIEQGALVGRGFKAFIMPVSQSLTEKEADQIKQFARLGGTVIADLRPGVLDSALNSRTSGLLDDLFGFTRPKGAKEPTEIDLAIVSGSEELHLPKSQVDGGVRLTEGKALGGSPELPVVIQNKIGVGRATLLNFGLGDYYDEWRGKGSLVTDLRNTGWGQNTRTIVAAILAEGSVRPRLQVLNSQGQPLIGVESVFFDNGENEFLGLQYKPDIIYFLKGEVDWIGNNYDLQPDISPVPIEVLLDKHCHIYDVRKGRYVGLSNKVRTVISPGQALLYALLPYRVTGIAFTGPSQVNAGERTAFRASLHTEGDTTGMHCLHVELRNPAGAIVREYAQNVIAPEGFAGFSVPFALNDAAGIWKVTVRDVASGETATADVELRTK